MKAPEERAQRVLRWYPTAWRERYGGEMTQLLVDTYGDRPLSGREYLALVRAGLVQRYHYSALVGRRAPREDQVRAGVLTVGFAWACFVVAGASFAKYSEHWDAATPSIHRALPEFAMVLLQWSAAVGAGLCASAALVSWSSWCRLVRSTGARGVARLVRPGLLAGVLATSTTIAVIAVAHHSSDAQRNGVRGTYQFVGLGWSAVLVVCLAVMTGNVGRLVRRLEYSRQQLRYLAVLARLLSVTMLAIFASFLSWWAAIARFAPRFLATGLMGVSHWTTPVPMMACAMLMCAGLLTAAWGVLRSRPSLA